MVHNERDARRVRRRATLPVGIMYWRNTEMASKLGAAWADAVKLAGRMDYMGEQNLLNDILRGPGWHSLMPPEPVEGTVAKQRGFVVYSRQEFGNVSLGMLPVANFAHGENLSSASPRLAQLGFFKKL